MKTVGSDDYMNSIPHYVNAVQKDLSLKGRNSVKINFVFIKIPHAHFYYTHKVHARFEKNPSKTVRDVNAQTLYPIMLKAAKITATLKKL